MTLLNRLLGGLRTLFARTQDERELDEELRGYLDAAIERHMNAGLSREAATRAARIELGSTTAVKDQVREAGWESRLDDLWQDARYAVRTLRKSPGFTAVAVLTLALAIGANTALFSIVNGLLLRPLPVAAPEQLVMVSTQRAVTDGYPAGWDFAMWTEMRQRASALGRAIAWSVFSERLDLATQGEADPVDGLFVSGNFFQELGVVLLLDRAFTSGEDVLGRAESRVAVISHGLWQRRFGADPSVVGRSILIHRVLVTSSACAACVPGTRGWPGVRPRAADRIDTADPQRRDVVPPRWSFVSRRHAPACPGSLRRSGHDGDAGDATPDGRGGVAIREPEPGESAQRRLRPRTGCSGHIGAAPDSRAVVIVLIIAALVLLIACANIANLLIARGAARRSE